MKRGGACAASLSTRASRCCSRALLTEPEHSLIHQSFHALERDEPLNGDGFGVAWYAEGHEDPALFRSVTPAWSNQNLRELARVTASHCVLAHVRAATQGLQVGEPNCHPFRRDRLAFMHNGDIGGFAAIRRPLLAKLSDRAFESIRGTTDSEHFFALLCDRLDLAAGPVSSGGMAEALRSSIATVLELAARHAPGEHMYLNAVITDGQAAVACRFTTDARSMPTACIPTGAGVMSAKAACAGCSTRASATAAPLWSVPSR